MLLCMYVYICILGERRIWEIYGAFLNTFLTRVKRHATTWNDRQENRQKWSVCSISSNKHMCAYIYIYIFVCVFIHMNIYTYINTCIYLYIERECLRIMLLWLDKILKIHRRCPRGVMVKAMDCGIVVSEFVLQSRYYVHFRTNTLAKGMNSLIFPAMG